MSSYEVLTVFNCPICSRRVELVGADWAKLDQYTCECPYCDGLLLKDGKQFVDFHERMHQNNPSWPENGVGTGFVDVGGN